MRVLIITDKQDSAIDILSRDIQEQLERIDTFVLPIHPKRPSQEKLDLFIEEYKKADVIHFQYWKTAEMLKKKFPEIVEKPSVLTHHNPYDVDKKNWAKEYDVVVVKNDYQLGKLPYAYKIPHTIDLELFSFKEKEELGKPPVVGMVASRIEGSKGIEQVAEVCSELEYKLLLVGRISSRETIENIKENAGDYLDFREDVSENELIDAYHEMDVLVVNSKDNFESGPLPLLEAMATGTPVITREVGQVPDINNGKNMIVRKGEQDDLEDLRDEIKFLMDNESLRKDLAYKGFKSISRRTSRHSARSYLKMYYKARSEKPLVSVVIPTFNRDSTLAKTLASIEMQDYPNKEIIVCDDNSKDSTAEVVNKARAEFNTPILYLNTNQDGYNLAMARNMGVVESVGDYLMFLDDRLKLKPEAIENLVSVLEKQRKVWVYGIKDGASKGFVENLSMIRRDEFVEGGMFLERMRFYGGMSEEIRKRYRRQGISFVRAEKAHAESIVGTSRWHNRKYDLVEAKFLIDKLYHL